MSVGLEKVDQGAAAVLARLHGECFIGGWDEAAMASLLSSPGAGALLARDNAGREVGFVVYRRAAMEVEIMTIGVRVNRRRQGIAKALLAALLERLEGETAAAVFLEVESDNRAARALYKRFGFNKLGRRERYDRRPESAGDTLVLKKVL